MVIGTSLLVILAGLTLPDALDRARRGEAVQVDAKVAGQAAAQIGPATPDDELGACVTVARAGGALRPLARALAEIARPGTAALPRVLRTLLELPLDLRTAALTQAGLYGLEGLLEEQALQALEAGAPPTGDAAQVLAAGAQLLVEASPPSLLASRVASWSAEPTTAEAGRAVLGALPHAPLPVEVVDAFAGVEVAEALLPALGTGLHDLALTRPEALDAALRHVGLGNPGAGGCLLRVLGAAPLRRYDEVSQPLIDTLQAEADDALVLAAAIQAGAELLVPELVPLSEPLTRPGVDVRVRVAMIDAQRTIAYRDRPTLTRLVALLGDPEARVRDAAWGALKAKSGATRIPANPAAWEAWLARTRVPDGPPVADVAERLAREREIRLAKRR